MASGARTRSRPAVAGAPGRGGSQAAPPVAGPLPLPRAIGNRATVKLPRAIGNRATVKLLRQPRPPQGQGQGRQAPPGPRPDFVFIMGADQRPRRGDPGNPFFATALAYWKAHLLNATFVTDKRDLDGVLTVLASGSGPIGSVYIVTHANEDGTLSFGLEATDTDRHLSVPELRAALHPASGTSRLTSVKHRVDAQTRIHIKGCDIGRTRPMIELIDEAFGGAGTVDAPTHEQDYGVDSVLADRARQAFRKEIEDAHPMPPPLDPDLKGPARVTAKRDRDKSVRDRQAAIAADLRSRKAEGDTRATLAGHFEAFSGPMFQRPGTALFTEGELRAQVDRLYPHLSETRRAALAAALTKMDRGTGLDQHGQRLITRDGAVFRFPEIKDVADAQALFGKDFRRDRFTPTSVDTKRKVVPGGFEVVTVVQGRTPDDPKAKREFFSDDVFPGDAELLQQAKAKVPNPDSYAWRIDEQHAAGQTTRKAVAERVLTYLHHESLDAAPHDPFTRPLTDKDFYATSTFGDPAPKPAKAPPVKGRATPAPTPGPVKVHRSVAPRAAPAARRLLLRQPVRWAPSGLQTAAPLDAYVKAAVDFYGDPKNADRTLGEYAVFLHGEANKALSAIGVPATRPAFDTTAGFIAQFEPSAWTVRMNPRRFPRRALGYTKKPITLVHHLNADEAAGAAGTIYHEVRHAEQHFRIARVGAARLPAGAVPPKPLSLLAPGIFDAATRQKLEATTANADLIAQADEWAVSATGRHAEYSGVVDDWLKEVEASHAIRIDPMHSDRAKRSFDAVIAGWRGARRLGFVKAQLRALPSGAKAGPADATVATNLKAIAKMMEKVEAAWRTVERGFDKATLHDRLDLLQQFQPVLYELAQVLDVAYRTQPHEADAFAAADEVVRRFLSIVNT